MKISNYHAKYFAYELTRLRRSNDVDRISQSLFDAAVDLNPHQIDAALFALQNPLSKGVVLADEVGLGKTIEAALVLCQLWAERRRRLIVICPASLRKQWATELSDKFQLPTQVLDARTYRQHRANGIDQPLDQDVISIISINYAARLEEELRAIPWDLVVIDEAHKLRNAYRDSHVTGQSIKRSLAGSRKLLLTATPLQNTLMELYGLSTIIDEQLFGDPVSFRSLYMRQGEDIVALKQRLAEFTKRTLRRQVLEYVQYTERRPLTIPFTPSFTERRLYDLISGYLQREDSFGIPFRQRHLVALIVRKLLASSTSAVMKTLETILQRLRALEQDQEQNELWFEDFINEDDFDPDVIEDADTDPYATASNDPIDNVKLRGEVAELESYLELAATIHEDEKSGALLQALRIGFERMTDMGSPRKAVIFTESRRTQDYLFNYLENHGFAGKVVTFSGANNSPALTGIHQRWLDQHQGSDKVTGSAAIDKRSAIIDYFQHDAEIMIATEAAAEGVNLQFCNLVINYDLPWNPQRVEQRIGRCHRYGQQFDVVVINFMNETNDADQRVLELLSEKFHLFDGIFGASDELLGTIESGVDFEKRIAAIYDTCRTPEAIEAAFKALQSELEESINQRMKETQAKLLENFDEQIHDLLRVQRERAETQLDRISRMFWQLTRYILQAAASFDETALAFELSHSPISTVVPGRYEMIRKDASASDTAHTYRLTHPLGEYVLDLGRRTDAPTATVTFDLTNHGSRIAMLEQLESRTGWLQLNLLTLESFQREEHLVFTAIADDGTLLDQEACERLFGLSAEVSDAPEPPPESLQPLVTRHLEAALSRALDENNEYFQKERDKLDQWAEDQIHAAEKQLEDTKIKIRDTKRKARNAQTMEEQKDLQEKVQALEKQQRRQRQMIFDVEDEIESRRDALIEALERRMNQHSTTHPLFTLRWQLA